MKPELIYLADVITVNRVKPDPPKIKAVSEFPQPRTKQDVEAFLGFAGYYKQFIIESSATAKPLNDFLKRTANENGHSNVSRIFNI